jgi:hypothetical protein
MIQKMQTFLRLVEFVLCLCCFLNSWSQEIRQASFELKD